MGQDGKRINATEAASCELAKDLALMTFLMLFNVIYIQEIEATIIMPPFNGWGNQGPERLTCPTHLISGRAKP